MRNHYAKLSILWATAILLVAALFPRAVQAQGSCDLNELATFADWADEQGYYGVSVDPANCRIDIIFENPGTVASSPTSPLPMPAASSVVTVTTTTTSTTPVRPITMLEITDLPEGPSVVKLDYVREGNEPRGSRCAEFISDAQKIAGYAITDAILDCQLLAQEVGAHTVSTVTEMEDGVRYLVWISNVEEHVLPSAYEIVYSDGISLVYLTALEVAEMDGVTISWGVAVE